MADWTTYDAEEGGCAYEEVDEDDEYPGAEKGFVQALTQPVCVSVV